MMNGISYLISLVYTVTVARGVLTITTQYVTDRFEMSCAGKSSKKYLWKRNDAIINRQVLRNIKFRTELGRETLIITSFKKTDNGVYKCFEITNNTHAQPVTERKATLLEEVKLESYSPMIKIKEGDTAVLWCNATSVPPPKIQWYIKQGNITADAGISGRMFGIRNMTRNCPKKYLCIARNPESKRGLEEREEIQVDTLFKPEVEIEASVRLPGEDKYNEMHSIDGIARIEKQLPYNVKLVCNIVSNPFSISGWYFNDTELVTYRYDGSKTFNTGHFLRSKISFSEDSGSSLQRYITLQVDVENGEEYGHFTCTSQNSEGNSNTTIILTN